VKAMPGTKSDDTKTVLLQIANGCRIFNAAHKVNFEQDELPANLRGIPMTGTKKKGIYTYKDQIPSLYAKTSLTFDYWVPKILDWTQEARERKVTELKNAVTGFDSCTDFMSICLLFLSDFKKNIPVAKAEDREAFLKLFGEDFSWKKKAAKREDIETNSLKIKEGLTKLNKETGITIPFEAWTRLQQTSFIKSLIK
jgi:hypothetical protein